MNARLLFVLLALAFTLPLAAQEESKLTPLPDAKAAPESTYVVECQMLTIPGKLLPSVVPDLNDETKVVATFAKVQGMIKSGEATLTGHLTAKGVWNQPVKAESLEEVRYATEYEPPKMPSTTPVEPSVETLKNWPHVGVTPTAFDTRNVGQTMEIEFGPTADARVFACTYVVQHMRFEKFVKIDAGRLASGEKLFVEQPYFSTMKDQSRLAIESDRPKLIGVHRLPGSEGVFELFILTLHVSPTKAP